jgi:hypothetical protein
MFEQIFLFILNIASGVPIIKPGIISIHATAAAWVIALQYCNRLYSAVTAAASCL